jgi:putative hydroxymethylpyrimidine transport system substrate-binding protein
MRKPRLSLALIVVTALVAGTGAQAGRGVVAARATQSLSLMLDWTPNPDHVGFYVAKDQGIFAKAGLDVSIHAPSDATTPLKLVALGRVDVAISYEQEVFYANAKHLPVAVVAAVVPRPLNSFMAIEPSIRSLHDIRGKTIGITGVPSDYATLDTALASVGLTRHDVKIVSVGYNLLPALLAHRVDLVVGVYRNVEAVQAKLAGFTPRVIPVDTVGMPTYDELVLVANRTRLDTDPTYRTNVRALIAGMISGTSLARSNPALAVSVMQKATALGTKFLTASTAATLPLLGGPNGPGCLNRTEWRAFERWLVVRGLLHATLPLADVLRTTELPSACR